MSISCCTNVYASKIVYQSNSKKPAKDKTNNCTYHTISEDGGTNICSDKDYDLQGNLGNIMI